MKDHDKVWLLWYFQMKKKKYAPDLIGGCRPLRSKQTLIPSARLEAVEAKTTFVLHNIFAVYLWYLCGPCILWNLTITTSFINIYSPSIPGNEKCYYALLEMGNRDS